MALYAASPITPADPAAARTRVTYSGSLADVLGFSISEEPPEPLPPGTSSSPGLCTRTPPTLASPSMTKAAVPAFVIVSAAESTFLPLRDTVIVPSSTRITRVCEPSVRAAAAVPTVRPSFSSVTAPLPSRVRAYPPVPSSAAPQIQPADAFSASSASRVVFCSWSWRYRRASRVRPSSLLVTRPVSLMTASPLIVSQAV